MLNRHAPFHGQGTYCAAAEFDRLTLRSISADMRDNCESNILCADADRGRAVDRDAHALRFSLPKCLRHQYVRYLRRSDSERVCAERTVSRCMAVATDNKQPG